MFRTAALTGLCLLAATADAQDSLEWNLEKGRTFYTAETMEIRQTVSLMGQSQKQDSSQTTVTSYKVLDRQPDGAVDLELTFEDVTGQGTASAAEVFQRIKGAKFQVSLDKDRKITEFEGYEDFVKRVSGGNEALAQTFRQILPPESLQTSVNQLFTVLPAAPVAAGDTWKQDVKVSLGPLGSVAVSRTLKNEGRDTVDGREYVRLSITGDAKYEAAKNGGAGLPFKISKADMRFQDLSGTALYDPQAKRLARTESSMKLNGTMTIQIGTNEQEVKLDQDQTIRVEVTDEKPAAPATE